MQVCYAFIGIFSKKYGDFSIILFLPIIQYKAKQYKFV